MSETRVGEKRSRWRTYFLLALVVCVIYPLSAGPSFWLAIHLGEGRISFFQDANAWFYFPLELVFLGMGQPEWWAEYMHWWNDL